MEGNINMSAKEAERIAVMENLISKRIKQKHAARQLDISVRQTQRLIGKYKKDGVKGLTHKSGCQVPNFLDDDSVSILKIS